MSALRFPHCRMGREMLTLVLLIASVFILLRLLARQPEGSNWENVNEDPPLIFISGQQSSGTGLARIILDAHPWINCGAEPIYTLRILSLRAKIERGEKDWLIKANIYPKAIDLATKAFIRELAVNMVDKTRLYCQKQPLIFQHLKYLAFLFPKAKFVHLLRDGRAAVASTITRGIFPRFTSENPHDALAYWDRMVRKTLLDCQDLGNKRCYTVVYEKLVLDPEQELRKLLKFLEVPWDPIVLRHETVLSNLSFLNPYEASTIQFSKKIHTDSLGLWASDESVLPTWFIQGAAENSSLLRELKYDQVGLPPDYTKLPVVLPQIQPSPPETYQPE